MYMGRKRKSIVEVSAIRRRAALARWGKLSPEQRSLQTLPGRTVILSRPPSPMVGKNLYKHGLTRSPEHKTWLSMMTRCCWSNPEREDWHLYQGKGITVCERWHEFVNFLTDMGHKPTPKHTIERCNSSLGYSPENCKWATPKEQANNTTRNRPIICNGETKNLQGWADSVGISAASMSERLDRLSVPTAVLSPKVIARTWGARGKYAKTLGD